MTSFIKFIYGSKEYLMIDSRETLNNSKVSCLDQKYTLANLSEKEVKFVKKKFIESGFESLKFFVNKNKSNSTPKCYKLLTELYDTIITRFICPEEYNYNIKTQTLCEKHISGIYNTTSIDSYPTTQSIHTSNNTIVIIVGVISTAVVILIVVALLYYFKRRNNNSSNEVSFC